MIMLVIVVVLTMNMDVGMGVCMLVRMHRISVAVFVGMRVIMHISKITSIMVQQHIKRKEFEESIGKTFIF